MIFPRRLENCRISEKKKDQDIYKKEYPKQQQEQQKNSWTFKIVSLKGMNIKPKLRKPPR